MGVVQRTRPLISTTSRRQDSRTHDSDTFQFSRKTYKSSRLRRIKRSKFIVTRIPHILSNDSVLSRYGLAVKPDFWGFSFYFRFFFFFSCAYFTAGRADLLHCQNAADGDLKFSPAVLINERPVACFASGVSLAGKGHVHVFLTFSTRTQFRNYISSSPGHLRDEPIVIFYSRKKSISSKT